MADAPTRPDPGPPSPPLPAAGRTGVWLVGARGSVATATVCGAAALAGRLVEPVGCVTERADFAGVGLPAYGDLVFGGHDVVGTPLEKRAELLADGGVLPHRLVAQVAAELRAADAEIRPGYEPGTPRPRRRRGWSPT